MNNIGHNQPNAFDALKDRVNELLEVGNAWSDIKTIATEEQAKKADDVLSRVRAEIKDVDKARLSETEPLRTKTKILNDQYNDGLKSPLEKITGIIKPLLTAYLKEKEIQRQRAAMQKAKDADEAIRTADAARRQADEAARSTGQDTIGASLAADETQKAADEAVKEAQSVHDSTVGVKGNYSSKKTSLRTTYSAEITDFAEALSHCANTNTSFIKLAVQTLANQWARSPELRKKPFPGVKLKETQTAS